jgi:hypothetical protein
VPRLQVETSLGIAHDEGRDRRPHKVDQVVRVQSYVRSIVIGVSHLRTRPSMQGDHVVGRMVFTGIDGRWMRNGVMLRGEWIDGRPFDGVATRGGYLDATVHQPWMGRVTAVSRVERLDYDAGPFSAYYRRITAGARVQATQSIGVQINVLRQPQGLPEGRRVAVDAGVTFSIRF